MSASGQTGPKRTPEQRNRDLVKLAKLYTFGRKGERLTLQQFAEEFGVSVRQICKDLDAIRAEWRARRETSADAMMAAELAKLDELEILYMQGWEKSFGTHVKIVAENPGADGGPTKETVTTDELAGDPSFLHGILKVQERRAKLLGLDAPVHAEVGLTQFGKYSDAELLAMAQKILTKTAEPNADAGDA